MAGYDGHASKRLRTDNEGHAHQSGHRDNFEDPHKPLPSTVVHVRGLSDAVIEADIVDAVQDFGSVSYVLMMPRKRQALIEFEDPNGARNCVEYSQGAHVGGSPAYFNYSTSQKIQRPSGDERGGNKVLLFTVLNPQYPITVDVMHTICSPNGQVLRIVIFKKNGVQAMVEFDDEESAHRAKQALNGADIYSGCCTLKIDYAKPTRLNVVRNGSESWDYTTNDPGREDKGGKGQPLLAEPRYGSAPMPYEGQEPPPPRRGPIGHGHGPRGGYGMDGYGGSSDGYESYGRMDRYGGPPPSRYGPPQDSYSMPPDRYGHGPPGPHGEYQEGPGGPGGMLQQGAVLMIYGLTDKMNCQRIFNLFCLYGNVVRIKFLKSKEGAAMIQMGDQASCERAMKNLNNSFFFGAKMQLGYSKQAYLQDPPNPHDLPDGTPSFMDYMGNRNNRFSTPENAQKNRIQPPAKVLHFFNAPPAITEELLNKVFTDVETKPPAKVKVFPSKSERSSTGLLEWDSKGDAMEGLVLANHSQIPNPSGKNPYIFKLCFSSSPILGQ